MIAPCQTKCRSAHPTTWAAGCVSTASIALVMLAIGLTMALSAVAAVFQELADFDQFLGGGALRRERLQHQLRGGAAKRAVDQIADELLLRLLLRELWLVDVRAIGLVASDEPFHRHDL